MDKKFEKAYKNYMKYTKSGKEKYKEKTIEILRRVDPLVIEREIENYIISADNYSRNIDSTDDYKRTKQSINEAKTYLQIYGLLAEAQPDIKEFIDKKIENYKKSIGIVEKNLESKI